MIFSHKPVMLDEVLNMISVSDPLCYVDLTSGGGGHAEKVIERFPKIKAVLIDRDGDAVTHLKEKFKENRNVSVVKSNFSNIDQILFLMQIKKVDIIFADLGVSSFQFDTPSRGFSIMKDGPFDMRMDAENGVTALEFVKKSTEGELRNILSIYAQERESGKIARVLKKCAEEGMTSTNQFANEIRKAKRFTKKGIDPSTQVFMAIRMAVNNETGELEKMLKKAFSALSPKGVMGIITFHSTEDRIVKNFFRDRKMQIPYYINENDSSPYFYPSVSISKTILSSDDEIKGNARSRSAKLRIISKG